MKLHEFGGALLQSGGITEADVLQAAGAIVGHVPEDWMPGKNRASAVKAAVVTARMLSAEIRLTGPVLHVPLGDVVEFVRGLRDSATEAPLLRMSHDPAGYVAARIDEHFEDTLSAEHAGMERRGCEPDGGLLRTGRPLTEHEESGAVTAGPNEREARDLLLRMGIAADVDLRQLVDVFNRVEVLQAARGEDQQRLLHYEGAIAELRQKLTDTEAQLDAVRGESARRRDALDKALARELERGMVPDGALMVPVEVCLGCNQQVHVRGDCGCPAGTGTRQVFAISEAEYRAKAKAVRQALLGPGVQDSGHPPTAEMAKALRDAYTRQLAECDRAKALLSEVGDENTRLQRERIGDAERIGRHMSEVAKLEALRKGDFEAIRLLMGEVHALQQAATAREVRCLRRAAEEIENSMRNPVVSDRELLLNGIAWYRAQADNLEGVPVDPVQQHAVTLHGGTPGGGKTLRMTMDRFCPTCGSQHTQVVRAVAKAAPEGQPPGVAETCWDEWHGESNEEVRKARQVRLSGHRCPTCDSPDPGRHPAVQHEGEVQVCRDVWHKCCPECSRSGRHPQGDRLCVNVWHSKVQP